MPDYLIELDRRLKASMSVRFATERRDVVDYSIVLLVERDGLRVTVRLYDGAHGKNELHRYTEQGGKQPAEVFCRDTLGVGMRMAIDEIERGYEAMIESWLSR
ncbi:MAG TPA: hypothetical protein VGL37_01495 [Solirubrobacteraceae bacterium]